MFKIVEEKKIGGSSKIFLKKIAIEKKKLPKLRQNRDLQPLRVTGRTDKSVEIVVIIDLGW